MRACSCRPCHSLIMERGEAELILLREAATILAVWLLLKNAIKTGACSWRLETECKDDTKNLEAGKLASYAPRSIAFLALNHLLNGGNIH